MILLLNYLEKYLVFMIMTIKILFEKIFEKELNWKLYVGLKLSEILHQNGFNANLNISYVS